MGSTLRHDPAADLVGSKALIEAPIGVPDLDTAAAVLKVPLAEVEQAAKLVTPWPSFEDPALVFWSVRQLARHIVTARQKAA